jgi:hypothetical protein
LILAKGRAKGLPCTVEKSEEDIERVGYPNDAFFKDVFSQPQYATVFFKSHLPPAIVAQVDWPSLKVLPSSFVKSGLQQVQADLLFAVNTGGRYNPSTNTWTATTTTGAPTARTGHTAVWTGTEMIVWGGTTSSGYGNNAGGRYNPATNTWTAPPGPEPGGLFRAHVADADPFPNTPIPTPETPISSLKRNFPTTTPSFVTDHFKMHHL